MNMQSKSFFFVILAIVLLFSVYKYDQIVIKRNYTIYTNTTCNPVIESCFISDCDSGEVDCDKQPYKKIEKQASSVKNCPKEDFCPELSCGPMEEKCLVTLCSEENKEPGEICSSFEDSGAVDTNATTTDYSTAVSESINN